MKINQTIRWFTRLIFFVFFLPPVFGLVLWPLMENNVFCAVCPSMQTNLLLIAKVWVWGAFYGLIFWLALALSAILLGRWWCGWCCPNGLVQEALNKLPIPKFDIRNVDLSPIKWGFLAAWILTGLFPTWGHIACITCQFSYKWAWLWYFLTGNPAYSCFYGQWFSHLYLFTIIFYGMALFLTGRNWCRTFCFVGQSTGLLHFIGAKLKIAKQIVRNMKLCTKCKTCVEVCPTGNISVLNDGRIYNKFHDCVMCQKCVSACPSGALTWARAH